MSVEGKILQNHIVIPLWLLPPLSMERGSTSISECQQLENAQVMSQLTLEIEFVHVEVGAYSARLNNRYL